MTHFKFQFYKLEKVAIGDDFNQIQEYVLTRYNVVKCVVTRGKIWSEFNRIQPRF